MDDRSTTTAATVQDVMTPEPTSIASSAMAVDAARAMQMGNVGSLPVVDGAALVGMVTDRDLVVNLVAKDLDPSKVPVSEVCTADPVTAEPGEALDTALRRMAEAQVRRLPVVSEGRLVGILAQADVARTARPEATGQLVEQISE